MRTAASPWRASLRHLARASLAVQFRAAADQDFYQGRLVGTYGPDESCLVSLILGVDRRAAFEQGIENIGVAFTRGQDDGRVGADACGGFDVRAGKEERLREVGIVVLRGIRAL